jgi:hypothetical protein
MPSFYREQRTLQDQFDSRTLADTRGPAGIDEPVLRTIAGTPISARRYDTIFSRARGCLDWTDRTPVSATCSVTPPSPPSGESPATESPSVRRARPGVGYRAVPPRHPRRGRRRRRCGHRGGPSPR